MKNKKLKNQKGQALIEFILVLPVLLLVLCALIDFGTIIYNKYTLENEMDYIVDLYKNDEKNRIITYSKEKEFKSEVTKANNEITFKITKNIKVSTPVLNKIIGNPYKIEINRVIYE